MPAELKEHQEMEAKRDKDVLTSSKVQYWYSNKIEITIFLPE